jgi:integrase
MKGQYAMFRRRKKIYYAYDRKTKRQESLRTTDKDEALRFLVAMNEASKECAMNLSLAQIYLKHSDPRNLRRTWQYVLDEIVKIKTGATQSRWRNARSDAAFDSIRDMQLLKTTADDLLRVLQKGTVSTNVYLRRIHNFALDMNWLSDPIIPRRQWPNVRYKPKRAILLHEHQKIIAREVNPERRAFYQLCWHIGASQGDIANLKASDVDWHDETISFFRRKSAVPVVLRLGKEALSVLKDLPSEGLLFPYLYNIRTGDRANEFRQRCQSVGIEGVTLHSYRYAWAERARACGYPERFAQEALGHQSKAVHWAYARKATVRIPSLEEYEAQGYSAGDAIKPSEELSACLI